jgi:phosphoribosyl-AMP cyclohydrolase / phosphoribosyl-ATP pyrophosphohydrolase
MKLDFEKNKGLIPAIIQDYRTLKVLMLGYMNEEAYKKTVQEKKVTFYSRTRNKLWTKGETSGNYLFIKEIKADCDNDTLLIKVIPAGPICHTGSESCFKDETSKGFLYILEEIITQRIKNNTENSYTNKLYKEGINRIAQKVGEEAVELIIESKDTNDNLFKNEAADLIYHFLVLLNAKKTSLQEIEQVLFERNVKNS